MAPVGALPPPSVPGPGPQRSIARLWVGTSTVPSPHETRGRVALGAWGLHPSSVPCFHFSLGFILAADLFPPHRGKRGSHHPRTSILAAPPPKRADFLSPFSLEMSQERALGDPVRAQRAR